MTGLKIWVRRQPSYGNNHLNLEIMALQSFSGRLPLPLQVVMVGKKLKNDLVGI